MLVRVWLATSKIELIKLDIWFEKLFPRVVSRPAKELINLLSENIEIPANFKIGSQYPSAKSPN